MNATEPKLHKVTLWLCDLCLSGAGGEGHAPGCAFWLNRAPDLPLHPGIAAEDALEGDVKIAAVARWFAQHIDNCHADRCLYAEALRLTVAEIEKGGGDET